MFIARNFGEDDDDVAMGPLVSLWWVDSARVRERGGGNVPGGILGRIWYCASLAALAFYLLFSIFSFSV